MKWACLVLMVLVLVGITGCTSLLYDDQKFIDSWDNHIKNDNELIEQLNKAAENRDIPLVKSTARELSRAARDEYYTVLNYQVSPEMETSQYYFARYLSAKVDCHNMLVTLIESRETGDTEYEEFNLDLLELKGRGADENLKLAYDNLPKD
jgi:hypothetical protein